MKLYQEGLWTLEGPQIVPINNQNRCSLPSKAYLKWTVGWHPMSTGRCPPPREHHGNYNLLAFFSAISEGIPRIKHSKRLNHPFTLECTHFLWFWPELFGRYSCALPFLLHATEKQKATTRIGLWQQKQREVPLTHCISKKQWEGLGDLCCNCCYAVSICLVQI